MAVRLRKTRSRVFWFHGSAAHAALTYMVIAQQQHNALAHLAAEFRLPVEEVQKRFPRMDVTPLPPRTGVYTIIEPTLSGVRVHHQERRRI